jgi:hypothetical protein
LPFTSIDIIFSVFNFEKKAKVLFSPLKSKRCQR